MGFLSCLSSIALLFLPLYMAQNSGSSTVDFHVGVILDLNSTDSPVGRIGMSCLSMALSDFYSAHGDHKTRLVLHVRDSNGSVVDAAAAALELLKGVKVEAIIGPQKSTQVNFVMDLGDRAHVPIISFSATSPSLVPRTPYFVQTAQSDANQVQAIASIVQAFSWNQVVIIYEDTEFGNGIIPYLSNAFQDVNARVSYRSVLPTSATDDFISKELYKMMAMQTRVFIVHTSQSLGTKLFLKVKELGMMSKGYVWIVTSGLTDLFSVVNSDVVEAMEGVLGVRPLIRNSKQLRSFSSRWIRTFLQDNQDMRPAETSIFGLWAYDTLWALAMAAERVGNSSLNETKSEAADPFSMGVSETGPQLLEALKETRFTGLAGEFNLVHEQLQQTPYQIINFVAREERTVGTWTPSGGISGEVNPNVTSPYYASKINSRTITWPGDPATAPRGWEVSSSGKKLRIGVPQKPGFNEFLKVEVNPRTNTTTVSGRYVEVFDAVIKALPYDLHYDYSPYPFINPDGSRDGNYNDLVYQVSLQEHYDAALGDITITANRSIYADFTLPHTEGGITSIVPVKYEQVNDVLTFLQPLSAELWLTTAIFYVSTSLATWILGNRIASSSRQSVGQHAGMTCYFPFFPGQVIEANLLCLILVAWAFVASLLNATYTASLSSRLTVARLQPTVTDVTQLIKKKDYVGCQEGSFLVEFLIKLGIDESRIRTYTSVDDSVEALSLGSKNGGISAYYDVLPYIRLILSQPQYCGKYMTAGPIYRTDGFAIAFPRGSPLVADISRAIIQLMENGTILQIEEPLSPACAGPNSPSSPTKVTLRSFLVLFAITGCVTLTCLVVSLLMHLHQKRSFPQRISDFNAKVHARIHAFIEYFKQYIPSPRPKTKNTAIQLPRR